MTRATCAWLGAIAIASICGAAAAGDASTKGWVGYVVPPYPSGVHELDSACMAEGNEICGYSVTVVRDAQSKLRTILALKQLKSFGKTPVWQVLDSVEPDILVDQRKQVAIATCHYKGRADARVVAVVQVREREWLPAIEAWRLGAAGQLQVVPARDVRCVNEGFGYDG